MFDEIIDRKNTGSIKWGKAKSVFNTDKDIIPMWVADMDFKVPDIVIQRLKRRAEHGIFGYTYIEDAYYDSIINWTKKRNNWEIKKEWIKYCPGVLSALNIAIRAFTNEGEKVLIQTPVYYPFYRIINNNKRIISENKLIEKDLDYSVDFCDLENKLKDESVKLFVLCNPHNPVGKVFDKIELEKIKKLCADNNVKIFSDEIHSDIIYNKKHYPIGSINETDKDNSITCFAPSKTFNIPGLVTASSVIKNKEMIKEFEAECERTGSFMPNVMSITAAKACYEKGENWLEELLLYLERNLDLIEDRIKSIKGVEFKRPEGTYLAWLDFRNTGYKYEDINKMIIQNAKIAVNDGKMFGELGNGFQRLNFACPRSRLREALENLSIWDKTT